MVLMEGVQVLKETAIKVRRDLHRIPESGFEEYKTSEYICMFLDEIGVEYEKNIAGTGIVGKILGHGVNKKVIAFRADMDALSMEELTGVNYTSEHAGFMHGCGHDGHMTMLLLFAKYLMENGPIKNDVVLIFQPAEEGPGGADVMIKEGVLLKHHVDEIFGIHLHPEFEQGTLAINHGPVMAMTGEFDVDIYTTSGHGAMPHTAVDGIVVLSSLVSQLQTIVSRNIDPTQAAVLTIGKVTGGERRNIIAEHVRVEGTIRAFHEDVYAVITNRLTEICKGTEVSFNCKTNLEVRTMYPPVVNHSSSVELFKAANKELSVVAFPPQMIAEDFSYYLKEVNGAFVFLGTKNEEKNYIFPLHNSKFNFDEEVLLSGVQSYINVVHYYENLI